jgi:hypothetical protein
MSHYVYFDARSRRFRRTEATAVFDTNLAPALPGVLVEWFIRSRADYRESVIIDTKCARRRSAEALKVLGHMANYGVRHGGIVLRHSPPRNIGGAEITPGLMRLDCPGAEEKRLWVITLVPSAEFEDENRLIMAAFAREALR